MRIFTIMSAAKIYDSQDVANFMHAISNEHKQKLNVTKVQKLLYIAYGYLLANKNRYLCAEKPYAWPYGPVFPRTRKKAVDYEKVQSIDDSRFEDLKKDKEVYEALDGIIAKYSIFSASKLSAWSHEEGGPWDKALKSSGGKYNVQISDEHIKEYFKELNVL